jgi:hypothetical protein
VAFFENLNKMTEQKKNILRSLLLMQLQGGSITRAEYNQKIAAISPQSVTPKVDEGLAAQEANPQCIAAQDAKPQSITAQDAKPQSITAQPVQPHQQSAIEAIDKEKARLCNMLHTVATNKSAKHITDKILALRLKRKEAYTNTRIADAAAVEPQCIAANGNGIAANSNGITSNISPYRQAENLRIKIMRWEKKLATDPENFELKQKLQDAKADYQSLRA